MAPVGPSGPIDDPGTAERSTRIMVEDLILDSYRLIAPKRAIKRLDADG